VARDRVEGRRLGGHSASQIDKDGPSFYFVIIMFGAFVARVFFSLFISTGRIFGALRGKNGVLLGASRRAQLYRNGSIVVCDIHEVSQGNI
jgi:hypothetical protein